MPCECKFDQMSGSHASNRRIDNGAKNKKQASNSKDRSELRETANKHTRVAANAAKGEQRCKNKLLNNDSCSSKWCGAV